MNNITYVVFDSFSLVDYKYNLFIKTTPKQITSIEIITATLPRIPNLRYLIMKIQNIDNAISLNDNFSIHDNVFALFYFEDNDDSSDVKS